MNELIQQFITDEPMDGRRIRQGTELWCGKMLWAHEFIIYRICLGMENTKYQEAVLVAKTYLLKKINSMAYQLHLEDIQNILD